MIVLVYYIKNMSREVDILTEFQLQWENMILSLLCYFPMYKIFMLFHKMVKSVVHISLECLTDQFLIAVLHCWLNLINSFYLLFSDSSL